jgi:uncharacterized protein YqeY
MRARITEDVKTAMKTGQKERLATLRLVTSSIKNADIDAEMKGKPPLGDADIVAVLTKMIKQRRDSVEQFTAGNRKDLADKELAEISVIEAYLPTQMDEAAARAAIKAAVAEVGATSAKDMGKVMAILKERFAGQMDFGKASGLVKAALK